MMKCENSIVKSGKNLVGLKNKQPDESLRIKMSTQN